MYDTRYGDPVPRILHIEIKPCTNYNGRKKELPNKGAKTVRRNCDNKDFFFFPWRSVLITGRQSIVLRKR